ncbi:MAG: AMP-binding protein, partial [Caulobacteraceae bacterium]
MLDKNHNQTRGKKRVGWNFGDILDAVGAVLPPETPAFIHGHRTISWGEATKATNNLARGLVQRGAKPGDKLAIYMRNRPEYLLALSAAFKARLTHVNVNYRYTPEEVWYIFDNSDAQTVVYASEFRDAVIEIR